MKKLTSILLVIALFASFCLPVLAVEGDPAFSARVTGAVDSIKCEGRDTLVLDWQLMANKPGLTLTNTQGICLTFDNSVLQLARWDATAVFPDGSMAVEDLGTPTLNAGRVSGNYKDLEDSNVPMRVYAAKSADGNKGFLNLAMVSEIGSTLWPQGVYLSLGQVRFAFREGKTEDDLTPDSIRLMTVAEMNLTNQRYGMLYIATEDGGAETFHAYLDQVGGELLDEGNIDPPKFSYPNSVPTIKSATIAGLVAPSVGSAPVGVGALSTSDDGYDITSITWMPDVTIFDYESTYSATIVLTSIGGYMFMDGVTPTVDAGSVLAAGTVGGDDAPGNTLTFTVSFDITGSTPKPTVTNPDSLTKVVGESATFSVTATSNAAFEDGTLYYQWKKDGVDIQGAINSSYTIPNVTITDAGNYTCAVYEVVGSKRSDTVVSDQAVLTVNKQLQTALEVTAVTGKRYGDADFQLSTTGGSTNGVVTYSRVTGPATVTPGGIVSITGVGDFVVKAVMAGNDTYEDVESSECTITVIKGLQSALTINSVTGKKYGDVDFQLSTMGGDGGGDVTYMLVSGSATVTSAGIVTIIGAGEAIVTASKAEDDYYESITSDPLTITIDKAQQNALIITPVSGKKYGDAPFMLEVTGGTTGGTVTFEKMSGTGTVTAAGEVTIAGEGDIVVKATMAGNANYEDVVSDNRTISIGKAEQATLTVNEVTGKTYGDAPFQLSAVGGTGTGTVTYSLVSGPATVTLSGEVTITGAGSIVVTATKASDPYYEPVISEPLTIEVAKAQQAPLSVDPVFDKRIGDKPFQLSVTGGSTNGNVTFELLAGTAVAVTSGGFVTIEEIGNATIQATMAGNENYEDTIAEITFTIQEMAEEEEVASPPTASPASGATFTDSLTVILTTETAGASIYYTTDGSIPTDESSTLYIDAITLTSTTTIKAIARKANARDSDIVTFTYTRLTGGNSYITPTRPPSQPPSEPIPDIVPPLAELWNNPYSDVVDTDWFYEAVRFVSMNGLMNGVSADKFSPNVSMTRAMVVTVLYRLEGEPGVEGMDAGFVDVEQGTWYTTAVGWAAKNEIVLGFPGGFFKPDDTITREEAVTILYRYAKYKGLDTSEADDLSKFADMDDISEWALDAMKWAVAVGIIQGRTATTAVPQGTSTRAEVAMIFKSYIEDFLGKGDEPEV